MNRANAKQPPRNIGLRNAESSTSGAKAKDRTPGSRSLLDLRYPEDAAGYEIARRKVMECCPDIDQQHLLVNVLCAFGDKRKPQKLTRKARQLSARLEALRKHAEEVEGPLDGGPVRPAWIEYLKALDENPITYRSLFRVDQEEQAYDQGRLAGAFAYGYNYDPVHPNEPRTHLCLTGNFFAEWSLNSCVRRWLDGYLAGWKDACSVVEKKKISRGVDAREAQPLPEFNNWLRKALALRLRNAAASRAKYTRRKYVRRDELKEEIRRRYEDGEIRTPNGKPVYLKDVAASQFFHALPVEDSALWENSDRGEEYLKRALTGAKRPRSHR